MTYTLIKDWEEHKTGEQVELDESVGSTLIGLGYAEESATQKTLEEEFQQGLTKFKDALTDTITNAVKDATEGVKGSGKADGIQVHDNELDDPMGGFKTGGEFLKAVISAETKGAEVDKRLISKAALGQNEADGAEGGFLLPPALADGIWERQKLDETGIMERVQKFPIAGNAMTFNLVADADASAASQRYGGVIPYRVAEAGTITPSTFKWRQLNLRPKKYAALVYATDEMLEDIAFGFSQWMNERVAFALTDELIEDILFGAGVAGAHGAFGSACCLSEAKETGQSAATIVSQNIEKLYARLPTWSRGTGIWLYNQEVEPQFGLLSAQKDVAGGYVPTYMPPGGLSAKPYGTIKGMPALPTEHCEALGTAGDLVVGDFSQYILCTKGGIKSAVSIHVAFTSEQTAFRFTMRADGAPMWDAAKTPRKGTAKLSPFVKIAARA